MNRNLDFVSVIPRPVGRHSASGASDGLILNVMKCYWLFAGLGVGMIASCGKSSAPTNLIEDLRIAEAKATASAFLDRNGIRNAETLSVLVSTDYFVFRLSAPAGSNVYVGVPKNGDDARWERPDVYESNKPTRSNSP